MGACSDRKLTLGVTELSRARALIDPAVCYIDVGSSHPGRAAAAKGGVVHPLKAYVSWVQNVARQFGGIYWKCRPIDGKAHQVREERWTGASSVPVV